MTGPLLEIRHLSTHYVSARGTRVTRAVDDVTLSLDQGQTLGIVGESGSGKTTLALTLLRMLPPAARVVAGEMLFEGSDLLKKPQNEMRRIRGKRIAMILQDPMMSLNPVMRVGDQLAETLLVHGKCRRGEAGGIVHDALKRVGIPAPTERMRVYPHEMSGGMRQRVAIANAIINRPDLIIADEPTTALDVTVQAQILYEMKCLARETGTALIWITHDLSVVKDLADDVCVMYAGRIVEQGPVADIISRPRHPYTRGLIDSLPNAQHRGHRLYSIPGATPPLFALPAGCAFSPRCGRATNECEAVPPVLAEGARAHRCFHPIEVV